MLACGGCGRPVAKGNRCSSCKRADAQRRKEEGRTGERGSTHESRQRRDRVLERDGYICRYCGEPATIADHVVPLSKGGLDIQENMVAACFDCNSSKGDKLLSEWPLEK